MLNQTITDIVKIMDRGLIVIPQKIREQASLDKGSYLRITLKSGEIILKPFIEVGSSKYDLNKLSVQKSSYSKAQGLEILRKMKSVSWSKNDDSFLGKGRELIEKRLKTNYSL